MMRSFFILLLHFYFLFSPPSSSLSILVVTTHTQPPSASYSLSPWPFCTPLSHSSAPTSQPTNKRNQHNHPNNNQTRHHRCSGTSFSFSLIHTHPCLLHSTPHPCIPLARHPILIHLLPTTIKRVVASIQRETRNYTVSW